MKKRPLIFVGSRDKMTLLSVAAELNGYEILGILDSHYYGRQDTIHDLPLIGDEHWLLDQTNLQAQQWLRTCDIFPANWWYGDQHLNKPGPNMQLLRKERINILEQSNAVVPNIIHPNSQPIGATSKFSSLKLGKGIFIDDDCWVCLHKVDIGDYCSITMNTKLAANTKLGKNVCVAPGAYLHHCEIGADSYIGSFSSFGLLHNGDHMIRIGKNCTIWAESRIIVDMTDNSIHTNTGRILKKVNH